MWEILSRFSGGELIGLVAVAGGILIGLTSALAAIIGAYVSCIREKRMAVEFVQDLLDRGVPPEEIAEIVRATGFEASDEPRPS